jgi:hypothetical protein
MSDSPELFEINEKGKIFTPVVTKKPVPVLIQTTTNLVRGEIYIRPSERLKEEIDHEEPTLAVTNAIVYSLAREMLYQTGFMAIYRKHIIWVIPMEELVEPEP